MIARRAKIIRVALAGNPNSGKTTVFNALTGERQHTGNYPGVTVEAKLGWFLEGQTVVEITDLPGTYSLTSRTLDERIARDVLLSRDYDAVLCVVDASNLERSLYLALQLMELELPLIIALNKMDLARPAGYQVDARTLSDLFGVTVIPTVAVRKEGLADLRRALTDPAQRRRPRRLSYGEDLDAVLERASAVVAEQLGPGPKTRWLALKLLEGDPLITSQVMSQARDPEQVSSAIAVLRDDIRTRFADELAVIFAERRYGIISGACQEAVSGTAEVRHRLSDAVDNVLIHPVWGIPFFLLATYLLFKVTFSLAQWPASWLETLVEASSEGLKHIWPSGWSPLLLSLLSDGVINGVGNVLVFLPYILFLFAGISLLEDSGYMARAAFIMDRFMHRIGLHGRSFIPLILGFGCTVPAVLATRTIEGRRERLTTIMILPLISCSARFSVYSLIIPAFFPPHLRAPILWLVYFVGVVFAIIAARILRNTLFRGEGQAFIMDLPPYRLPTLMGLLEHMWRRTRLFVRKAGTIILGMTVIMWYLSAFPQPSATTSAPEVTRQPSYAEKISRALEPILKPMGFDWRIGTALIGAVVAKEVFISQLAVVFATEEQEEGMLQERLRAAYPPLVGLSLLLFILISMPCVATVGVVRLETGSLLIALAQVASLTLLAWIVATGVYQVGSFLGLGIQ